MQSPLRILFIEDSPVDEDLLLAYLKAKGFAVEYSRVYNEAMLDQALDTDWDTIICDYHIPGMQPLTAVGFVKEKRPDIPIIVVSGSAGEEVAVEAMRAGASDYVTKQNLARLRPAIERCIKERNFRTESRQIEESLKRREEELRQAQKLEAVGQLAGGIAHDFNNILATILLQTDALTEVLQTHGGGPFDEVREGLALIRDAGARASNLTRQLLAFSRKQILQPKVLNLNLLIGNLQKMLRPIIEENIRIVLRLGDDIDNIKADPGHIEQILMNLMVNSRDAMPNGGTLEIETGNSSVDEETAQSCNVLPGPYVLMQVKDTGTGISPEAQKHLFEPFYTTKPIGKGTGMGLSTVYGIVKQNRGLIFIESELDKGTTFKVYFPRVLEPVETATSRPAVGQKFEGTGTILFVEDEESLRGICCKVLEKNGFRVLSATNGVEALEKVKLHPSLVHLVITDVVLPELGGVELARKISQVSPQTKILFQSGYTENTLLHSGIRSGRVHFLEKPYRSRDLLAKVHSILSDKV